MKRKPAPEALYDPKHYDSHHPVHSGKVSARVRSFDPDGKKGLALLQEIESQQIIKSERK